MSVGFFARWLIAAIIGAALDPGTISAANASGQNSPVPIYVAAEGFDGNDGSTPQMEAGLRGPVKTLERARALAQIVRQRVGRDRTIEITIAPGTYPLSKTLVLSPQDSGVPGAPVIYRGMADGSVFITGGHAITGWRPDPVWGAIAEMDPKIFGRTCPTQLFVNGNRRTRPRFPSIGTYSIAAVPSQPESGQPAVTDHFFARPDDLGRDFKLGHDTEIVIFDAWTASRLRVVKFDSTTKRLDLKGTFAGHGNYKNLTVGLPYYIENQPVSLLAPGEWRCDPNVGLFYYRPLPDEDPLKMSAIAPRLQQLVALRGRVGAPVHDVIFEDLVFEHAAWHLPANGWAAMQAEVGLPAAIEMEGCQTIKLLRVTLRRSGAEGVGIRQDCSDVEVSDGRFEDLGGGGLAIGSAQRYPTSGSDWEGGDVGKRETFNIRIIGNHITSIGRVQHAAVGIWSGQAHHVQIERNRIKDLFYSGISIGWSWNSKPSLSHDNSVVDNVIEDFGQGMLSDFAGIYTLGRQNNTLIDGNLIVGGVARAYGGHGLYADEGSAGIVFSHNLIRGTSHAAIHVHYGTELTFADNRAENYGEAAVRCSRPSLGQSVMFERNFFRGTTVPTTRICSDPSYSFRGNTFTSNEGNTQTLDKAFGQTSFSKH